MKGLIQDDHMPLNKYILTANGEDYVFTEVSGIEEELNTVQMPDRTVRSGGRTNTIEFTVMLPLHHVEEQSRMEAWFEQSQISGIENGVDPNYKRTGLLRAISLSGAVEAQWSLIQLFPSKRALPDFEMNNDGEMAQVEWTLVCSDAIKL